MPYPSEIDSFSNPQGTTLVSTDDHALQHRREGSAIVGIETTLGTTVGTSVLKNFSAGQFPVRMNTSNVLQHVVQGTLGTPTFNMGSDAQGDLYYRSSSGTVARLAPGTAGQVLQTGGGTANPSWVNTTGIISTSQYAPQGLLINGKIVPSVSGNNLTLAIKGMDGNDPSVSNPVYVRIGDTVRTITSALSVSANAATNWMNLGSSEFATKEADLFVYLGYNATDGVVLGFSRIPYARRYGDFSATSTNEKYARISTITTAASTDYYENIGRFAATLSAGAGYTWTVPTFTALNLIQRPIYESRWLTYAPTVTGFSANPSAITGRYKIAENRLFYEYKDNQGTSNATTKTVTLPFTTGSSIDNITIANIIDNGTQAYGKWVFAAGQTTINVFPSSGGTWTASGNASLGNNGMNAWYEVD